MASNGSFFYHQHNYYKMSIGSTRVVSVVSDTEPVTLAEAKSYLRVTTSQDDAKITSQISAARSIAEAYLNRDILPREREQFIENLHNEEDGVFELYGTPIDSTEDITITIEGNSTTEDSEWKKYGLEYDQKIQLENAYAIDIKITYQTLGLINDATVKQGVLAILAELYEYGEITNKWIWAILKPLRKPFL